MNMLSGGGVGHQHIIKTTWRWGWSRTLFWFLSPTLFDQDDRLFLPSVLERQGSLLSYGIQALPRASGQHYQFKVWPHSLLFELWWDRYGEELLWPSPEGELLGSRAGRRLGSSQAGGSAWKRQPWRGECQLSVTVGYWPLFKQELCWPACGTPVCLVQDLSLASVGCSPSMLFGCLLWIDVGREQSWFCFLDCFSQKNHPQGQGACFILPRDELMGESKWKRKFDGR